MRLKKAILGASFIVMSMIPSFLYAEAFGTVATDTLNVRKKPNTQSSIVKQLDYREAVEVRSIENTNWFKLWLKDDSVAYVHTNYISVHRVVATVTAPLNVRSYPSMDGKKIGRFEEGEEISVHYRVGDWYNISQEGFKGYVHKDYVKGELLKYLPTKSIKDAKKYTATQKQINAKPQVQTATSKKQTKPKASAPKSNDGDSSGSAIVQDAKQFLGNPYVYGGNSLTSGVDCSGFTQQIMKRHGIYLSRSSSAQYSNDGYSVSADNLAQGDLVFYGYNGRVSHVGIYIGNGQIIHANDERTGIRISSLYPSGGKPFIGAKRVI